MRSFLFLLCFVLLGQAQAGQLYRSVDSHGKVHYSDKPSADAEKLNLGVKENDTANLSYETQRANQNFPVTFYSFPECGAYCQQARDLLTKRGIPFTEKILIQKTEIDEFTKQSGNKEMPAMTVGKTWLKGFLADQWNKELDFAGYPKIAPYRSKPAPAQ
ncbi:MAG: glutaredoxin family protein [Sideroxydans sp.]|nr:glutaredoxin family protein [Sideroxydans sp.]